MIKFINKNQVWTNRKVEIKAPIENKPYRKTIYPLVLKCHSSVQLWQHWNLLDVAWGTSLSAHVYLLLLRSFCKLLELAPCSLLLTERRGNHEAMGKESGICFCKLIEIPGVTMQGLLVTAREIVCLNANRIVHLMTQCGGPRLRLSMRTCWKILGQKSWRLPHRSHECGKRGVISANYSWPIRESLGVETHSWFWWLLKEMVPRPPIYSLCPAWGQADVEKCWVLLPGCALALAVPSSCNVPR